MFCPYILSLFGNDIFKRGLFEYCHPKTNTPVSPYRSFHCHAEKEYIGNHPVEEAKKTKSYKRLIYNNLSKSLVLVAHSFWVICRNDSRTFVELCMEMPYWCIVLVHQYGRRKSTKTSGVHFFYKSSFFPLDLRVNISSNTWNGFTAENQEERLF